MQASSSALPLMPASTSSTLQRCEHFLRAIRLPECALCIEQAVLHDCMVLALISSTADLREISLNCKLFRICTLHGSDAVHQQSFHEMHNAEGPRGPFHCLLTAGIMTLCPPRAIAAVLLHLSIPHMHRSCTTALQSADKDSKTSLLPCKVRLDHGMP